MTFIHIRRLLAAGALIGCGIAHAQSTVAISGGLDIGLFRDKDDIWKVGNIGRSHLQFAGMEDLGGGLAATFKLRTRFDLDTGAIEGNGSKPFWHGESTVGLKGAFGAVRLGRALDAIQNQDWAFDPGEITTGSPLPPGICGTGTTRPTLTAAAPAGWPMRSSTTLPPSPGRTCTSAIRPRR